MDELRFDKWRYAVQYCEEHECGNCFIYKNNLLDTMSEDYYSLNIPCWESIYSYLERNNLDYLPGQTEMGVETSNSTDLKIEITKIIKELRRDNESLEEIGYKLFLIIQDCLYEVEQEEIYDKE